MPPQDDVSRRPDDEPTPLVPEFKFFDLSEDAIRRLQEILEETTGHPWRPLDVRHVGIELLDLTAMLLDPASWSYWRKNPAPVVPAEPESLPPPVPRPYPIRLDADHDREIVSNLKLLEDELRWVKRRPTSWRWVIVALYNALGHALAKHRPESYRDDSGPGQLTALFDVVAAGTPELLKAKAWVELVVRLRTSYIEQVVTRWPVDLKMLTSVTDDCRSVIELLVGDLLGEGGLARGKAGEKGN